MVFKVKYEWEIQEVNIFPRSNIDFLDSPIFCGSPDKKMHHWKLSIGWQTENPNNYGVYLELADEPFQEKVRVKYLRFQVFNKECEIIYDEEDSDFYTYEIKQSWGFLKAIDRSKHDIKTIKKMSVEFEIEIGSTTEGSRQNTVRLGHDFLKLYNNKNSADITVLCDNGEIKVHKLVLIARSSVFQAMFESNMQESVSNTIPLLDSNPEVVEVFFKYMYCGSITIPLDHIEDILDLGEQYDVAGLKRICELEMCEKVVVSNAAQFLCLAYKYNMKEAKEHLIKFVAANILKVMETEGWVNLKENEIGLIEELFVLLGGCLNIQ